MGIAAEEGFDLSESLSVDVEVPKAKAALEREHHVNVNIRPCTTFEALDESLDTPPAQIAQREWSLVFNHLETTDLDAVNLTCRFFYCVLQKYPPDAFRVYRVASVLERTSSKIGHDLLNFERSRTVVRLEVGIFNLGNHFGNKDLQSIMKELYSLRFLKLMFCHLLSEDGFKGCAGLHGATQLQSLTLFSMRVPIADIVGSFPNLRHLVIAGPCELTNTRDIPFVQHLAALPNLRLLGIGELFGANSLSGLTQLRELSLTHLWLEGLGESRVQPVTDAVMRARCCFQLTEAQEFATLTSGQLCKTLREYVSARRSPDFVHALKQFRTTHIDSDTLRGTWSFPEMAQFSWGKKSARNNLPLL